MLRVAGAITALFVSLLVLTPVVWASTAETWTNGIYDYEPDDVVQVVAHNDVGAVHSNPTFSFNRTLVTISRLVLSDQTPVLEVVPSASRTRGPPFS